MCESIENKIKNGYYNNKLEYPKRPARICDHCNNILPRHDMGDFCKHCGKPIKDAYHKKMELYNTEDVEVIKLFKQELIADFGVDGNDKANLLFDKAWDRGHSAGLHEVYGEFEELVDLIR